MMKPVPATMMSSHLAPSESSAGQGKRVSRGEGLTSIPDLRTFLKRRGGCIVLAALAGLVVAWLVHLLSPADFRSTAKLQVPSMHGTGNDSSALSLHAEKIKSLSFLSAVVTSLRDSEFTKKGEVVGDTALRLRNQLHLNANEAGVLDLEMHGASPEEAKQLADAVLANYLENHASYRGERESKEEANLKIEAGRFKKEVESAREALQRFRDENGLQSEGELERQAKKSLAEELSQVTGKRLAIESDIKRLERAKGAPGLLLKLPFIQEDPELRSIQLRIADEEAAFAQLKKRYLHRHPKYKDAESKLISLRNSLAQMAVSLQEGMRGQYDDLKSTEDRLAAEIQKADKVAVAQSEFAAPHQALEEELAANQMLYNETLLSIKKVEAARGIEKAPLEIVEHPFVHQEPVSMRQPVRLALGLGAGLLCGLGFAFWREGSDTRLRSASEVESILSLPVLASIPKEREAVDQLKVVPQDCDAAQAFRNLHVSSSRIDGRRPPRSVLFLSQRSGDGKSFCALNYAVTMANLGRKTLIIDANLASPSLSLPLLNRDNGYGLSDYFSQPLEDRRQSELCHLTQFANLYHIPAGKQEVDSTRLLESPDFRALIMESANYFEQVVLDVPALAKCRDAISLASLVEGVFLVARNEQTTKRDLLVAARHLSLAGITPMGALLNAAASLEETGDLFLGWPTIQSVQEGPLMLQERAADPRAAVVVER